MSQPAYNRLVGEPSPREQIPLVVVVERPTSPEGPEQLSLEQIIEKTQSLSDRILKAKDACEGISNSYEYYNSLSHIDWSAKVTRARASMRKLNELDSERSQFLKQTETIFREFCSYDKIHYITEKSTPEADTFKELIQKVDKDLESLGKSISFLKGKYSKIIHPFSPRPASVSRPVKKRSKCCWPFKLCCK